jgi:hypothetical protein
MLRKEVHPLFLVGAEALIEWLPRISELFEVGAALGQVIGAFTQEFDRINVTLLTEPFCQLCQPAVPSRCPGADSFGFLPAPNRRLRYPSLGLI